MNDDLDDTLCYHYWFFPPFGLYPRNVNNLIYNIKYSMSQQKRIETLYNASSNIRTLYIKRFTPTV